MSRQPHKALGPPETAGRARCIWWGEGVPGPRAHDRAFCVEGSLFVSGTSALEQGVLAQILSPASFTDGLSVSLELFIMAFLKTQSEGDPPI